MIVKEDKSYLMTTLQLSFHFIAVGSSNLNYAIEHDTFNRLDSAKLLIPADSGTNALAQAYSAMEITRLYRQAIEAEIGAFTGWGSRELGRVSIWQTWSQSDD